MVKAQSVDVEMKDVSSPATPDDKKEETEVKKDPELLTLEGILAKQSHKQKDIYHRRNVKRV